MGVGSAPELRVEELAGRADVSVDTIRFYQKRQLLPPPQRRGRIAWYGPEHVERLARIKDLQGRGFSLAVIRRIVTGQLDRADEPLAAAVIGADDDSGGETDAEEFLTLDELAARSGVPEALIESIVREGLLVPRRHEGDARFTSADVDILGAGLRLLETGLPMPELLTLARRHHDATRETAEGAVAMFDTYVREPLRDADLTDDERAERLVEAFRVLLPSVTALVAHHFRRVLLEVAQEHLESVGEPAELDAANAEASRRLEVVWP
ncbi:MAG TPA: MerR family transcriptional regulator [Acidimicrobiia bacterium]|nr:MerR family transcriptional regulator [Acidimicrobiia bacterium]